MSRAETVRAAGAVLWRRKQGATEGAPSKRSAVEVALVHRPKYDDWSFPKGKLDPGETHEEAAVREVEEETACRGELGAELAGTSYVDAKGRPKTVRYWTMELSTRERFVPNDEIDEVDWVDLEDAARRLSYDHDVDVLNSFLEFAAADEG